jgi:hypothetical protein
MMNLLYTNNKSLLFNFADRVRLAKSATLPQLLPKSYILIVNDFTPSAFGAGLPPPTCCIWFVAPALCVAAIAAVA